jgi:protein TonB
MSRLIVALALSLAAHLALLLIPPAAQTERPGTPLSVRVQMPALADGPVSLTAPPQRPAPAQPTPGPDNAEAQPATTRASPQSTVQTPPDTAIASSHSAPLSTSQARTASEAAPQAQGQRWLEQLRQRIEEISRYPSRARLLGQEGTVILSFRVNEDGSVSDAGISQPSPFSILDQAALAALQKSPMPLPPVGLAGSLVTVPVSYQLQRSSESNAGKP